MIRIGGGECIVFWICNSNGKIPDAVCLQRIGVNIKNSLVVGGNFYVAHTKGSLGARQATGTDWLCNPASDGINCAVNKIIAGRGGYDI